MLTLNTTDPFKLLTAVSIPYLLMENSNGKRLLLITRTAVTKTLAEFVKEGTLAIDEASLVQREADQRQLLEDWNQFRAVIKNFPVLDDASKMHWQISFNKCNCNADITHGYIEEPGHSRIFRDAAETLFTGLIQLHELLDQKHIDIDSAVRILKQMVNCNLPGDSIEHLERFNALPPEIRRKYVR